MNNVISFKKSVVFQLNGVSVGVIGYLTPDTQILAKKNDVVFSDEIAAIK